MSAQSRLQRTRVRPRPAAWVTSHPLIALASIVLGSFVARLAAAFAYATPRYFQDEYVYAALAAGASGFLLKDVSPEQLTAAVMLVRSGDALLAPSITRRLVERFAGRGQEKSVVHRDLAALTPREREVLQMLARGLSNAELAAAFQLSEATVKTHVARILGKLQLRDRVQAVVVAYETGLVAPGEA